jgi:hypothetical protein
MKRKNKKKIYIYIYVNESSKIRFNTREID